MGNCALKPKVLSETGAPAPEEFKDSLLEYHKINDAAKSLSNLFLQDKAEKTTKDDDQKAKKEEAILEDKAETKASVDDQKAKKEVAILEEKVIDAVTVKETETEAKEEEVGREAAQ